MRRLIATVCACWMAVTGAVPSASAVEIVSPRDGQVVTLLPDAQREVMSLTTQKARSAYLKRYRETVGPEQRATDWHRTKPLVLRWKPESIILIRPMFIPETKLR